MGLKGKKVFEHLPNDVIPLNYKIRLQPDLCSFTFSGTEDISVEVKKVVKVVKLNCDEIEIQSAVFKGPVDIQGKVSYVKELEIAVITFPTELKVGSGVLSLGFTGQLNDRMKGFYRTKYTTPAGKERYAAVTQFEATDARRAFPCWDEPAIKATFDVTMVGPADRVFLSNMPVISETSLKSDDSLKVVVFERTPIMSTYLLAFIVGEFDYVEATDSDGVVVRVYTPLGKKGQGQFALQVAVKTLPFYRDYFKIPYSLPKLDLIAIPDFSCGAMENWGLVTYRETALLIDPCNSAAIVKQHVALVVGHELAHQWFGNLVTMKWWTYLWLNEGFATFIEYLCVDLCFPEFDVWTQFINMDLGRALELDALDSSHPIEVEVRHPTEVDEIFDAISYSKGASVIRMLHDYIGGTAFRKGLNLYLTKHMFGNTVTEDLWESLEESSSEPVAKMMSTWTGQKGFPVLQVNCSTVGMYRVQYASDMLQQLVPAIRSKSLPPKDRLGLQSDLYALSRSGYCSAVDVLAVTDAFVNEDNFTVWRDLSASLASVAVIMQYTDAYPEFKQFCCQLFGKICAALGWDAQDGEGQLTAMLRALVLGRVGWAGEESVVAEARKRFQGHCDGRQPLHPDLRSSVYSTVLLHGGEAEFDQLLELYDKADMQEERMRIARNLGSTTIPSLIGRVLLFAMSDKVRSQDTVFVVMGVMGSVLGRDMAWQFIKDNWDQLYARYNSGFLLGHLIKSVEDFASVEKADEIKEFFKSHEAPTAERAVQQACENILVNVDWLKREGQRVATFLKSRK